jgi:hypothetical protein
LGTVVSEFLAAPAEVAPLVSLRDHATTAFGVFSSVIWIAVMVIVGFERL